MGASITPDHAAYDLAILGGGTGGYVAAIRAAQLGLKVALIEEAKVGGTCLHKGCISSKAYLRSAEIMHWNRQSAQFGIACSEPVVHWDRIVERNRQIVQSLFQGVRGLIRKNKIDLIEGRGQLVSVSEAASDTSAAARFLFAASAKQIRSRHAILATGSRPATMGLPIDPEQIMTSDQALERASLPQSAIIIGGGTIGMEWASLYCDFGVKVTVVETCERILPTEDHEVANALAKSMTQRGTRILTNTFVNTDQVKRQSEGVQVPITLADGTLEILEAEAALLAVGRCPNTDHAVSPSISLALQGKFIFVNGYQETNIPGLYAIGDVCGGGLAHVAVLQGTIAAERMAKVACKPFIPNHVPKCTYTRPEIASIGYTEAEARRQGIPIKIGKFPFRAVGKALVQGEFEGFAKIVADRETNAIVGVHVIGAHATEIISESSLVLANGLDLSQWLKAVHPHPSMSEVIHESLLAAEQRAIHI